jgi:hypothetical protein
MRSPSFRKIGGAMERWQMWLDWGTFEIDVQSRLLEMIDG